MNENTIVDLMAANRRMVDTHNAHLAEDIRRVGKLARKQARAVRSRVLQRRAFEGRL